MLSINHCPSGKANTNLDLMVKKSPLREGFFIPYFQKNTLQIMETKG